MSSDPKLRAKVRRIAQLEWLYRLSLCWRPLLLMIMIFFYKPQSNKDIGPITEWFLTREVIRFFMVSPIIVPFIGALWLTYQLELATKPAAPVCSFVQLWKVSCWLCVNKILLVLELLSEMGCIWAFSEGIFELKPLSPLFLGFEISVSMIYLGYRWDSLCLVARFVKELEQEHNSPCFQPSQIQEQTSTPNPVPPKETSIAIPD